MKSRRIYVASSWRNEVHPQVVKILRDAGHEVYDFRLPDPNNPGFSWGDIAGAWKDWRVEDYIEGLKHPIAHAGFLADKNALDWCDTCILLLPCGKSAHLEAGYAIGKGKERHANDLPFEDQPIMAITRLLEGHPCGALAYQAIKKIIESGKLLKIKGLEHAVAESHGAMNYTAAMAIFYRELAAKHGKGASHG